MSASDTLFASSLDLGQEAWLRYRLLPLAYRDRAAPWCGALDWTQFSPPNRSALCENLHTEWNRARAALCQPNPSARPVRILRDDTIPAEGYAIEWDSTSALLRAADELGVRHGVFRLIGHLQEQRDSVTGPLRDVPCIPQRIVQHWDNVWPRVDIERGYGGESLWRWAELPQRLSPRYDAYARLLASVGVTGLVVNNVNASEPAVGGYRLLTDEFLPKLAALAAVFRAWGIRLGLSVSYHAPILCGELSTADPRESSVRRWWCERAQRLFSLVPDCLGWVVKADSEGQPGPQQHGLDHAEGSRVLADALAPFDAHVYWRAFVYRHDRGDVLAQPYRMFKPLDGQFPHNLLLQIKSGPRDFQVHEPPHPLLGGLENTNTALELQITQEYHGHDTHLVFLPVHWERTFRQPVIRWQNCRAVVGVANVSDGPNWTGHLFAQANLYGWARLAWNPLLPAAQIAREWSARTFTMQPRAAAFAERVLLESYDTYAGYTVPFGMGQVFNHAETWHADHFDPAPWLHNGKDWFCADQSGIGVGRTTPPRDELLRQYPSAFQTQVVSPHTCPPEYLLWFHHLPWDWRLADGRSLIQAIFDSYRDSAARVDDWLREWIALRDEFSSDPIRFAHVLERLLQQRYHARLWARYMTDYLQRVRRVR